MNQPTRAFKIIKDCYKPIVICLFNRDDRDNLVDNRLRHFISFQ